MTVRRLFLVALSAVGLMLTALPAASAAETVPGVTVSAHDPDVNWPGLWDQGYRWVYVKDTEGTTSRNPYFAAQTSGARQAGFVAGAYHFALPNASGGAAQADFLLANGGGWSADGKTLPPALDIEYNPYGPTCYGLSQSAMVDWIRAFSDTVDTAVGRYPVIYTTRDWWQQCTGNTTAFAGTNPLWVTTFPSGPATLPGGWKRATFTDDPTTGTDEFNGSLTALLSFARG